MFRDLRPYTCLSETCTTAGREFSSRRSWFCHMVEEHWRSWACAFGCADTFLTPAELRLHLVQSHSAHEQTVESIMSISSRADADRAIGHCPLCRVFEIQSHQQYLSHVGHHLEQLALFVLPSSYDAEEETSTNVEAEASTLSTPDRPEISLAQYRDLGAEDARDNTGIPSIEEPRSQHDQLPEVPQPDYHYTTPEFDPPSSSEKRNQTVWRWTCV